MTVTNDPYYTGHPDWDGEECPPESELVIDFRDKDGEDPFAKDPEPLKSVALQWVHQLLDDANDAIRYLCGDIVAKEVEDAYDIGITNADGQEIFKSALDTGAVDAPLPPNCLQAVARAFGVGEDL
jgi:hypothetical protein